MRHFSNCRQSCTLYSWALYSLLLSRFKWFM